MFGMYLFEQWDLSFLFFFFNTFFVRLCVIDLDCVINQRHFSLPGEMRPGRCGKDFCWGFLLGVR